MGVTHDILIHVYTVKCLNQVMHVTLLKHLLFMVKTFQLPSCSLLKFSTLLFFIV